MAGYSNTPLLKKLGIKEGFRVIFLDAPAEIINTLEHDSFLFENKLNREFDYIHVFSLKRDQFERRLTEVKPFLKKTGMLWVSWPKAGKLGTDLNENIIRDIGLEAGMVDVKVAAIDETWSGLKFVFRLTDR